MQYGWRARVGHISPALLDTSAEECRKLLPPGVLRANPPQRRRALRGQRTDVVTAMSLAGLVNMAMLVVAAALFTGTALTHVDTLARAHAGIATTLDGSALPSTVTAGRSPCSAALVSKSS